MDLRNTAEAILAIVTSVADIDWKRNPLSLMIDVVNPEGLLLAVKPARDGEIKIILHGEPPFWFSFQNIRLGWRNQQGGEEDAGEGFEQFDEDDGGDAENPEAGGGKPYYNFMRSLCNNRKG